MIGEEISLLLTSHFLRDIARHDTHLCSEDVVVVVVIIRLLYSNSLYERTKEINRSLIIASAHRPQDDVLSIKPMKFGFVIV